MRHLCLCGIVVAVAMAMVSQVHAADCSAEQDAYNEWRAAHAGESPDLNDKCAQYNWCMEVNGAKMALITCQCEGDWECIKKNRENCGERPPNC